ncbi:hypothetical protein E3N88_40287 [Mikania micrantha]|uniref:Uncharacterized protein n=1 Tax=Mikania micrantha TaxID=192012 RepID=A0A5N6LM54_9ASTR|nr:hypothetical protein E3N88_40287 [Mikania micrantha]
MAYYEQGLKVVVIACCDQGLNVVKNTCREPRIKGGLIFWLRGWLKDLDTIGEGLLRKKAGRSADWRLLCWITVDCSSAAGSHTATCLGCLVEGYPTAARRGGGWLKAARLREISSTHALGCDSGNWFLIPLVSLQPNGEEKGQVL